MDTTHNLTERQIAINDRWTFIQLGIRLLTGFLLMVKGFYFVSHSVALETLLRQTVSPSEVSFLLSYIGFAHLFGGAFIILGLLTRFAVILQIPVIIGAVYYNLSPNALASNGEIVLSIIVLILLVYILIKGSGKFSMDFYRKRIQL